MNFSIILIRQIFIVICLHLWVINLNAQEVTQNLRGRVIDSETRISIPGVNLTIKTDSLKTLGSTSDENGEFVIKNIPVGKYVLKASFIGYKPAGVPVNLRSAKEMVVEIELTESAIEMDEVVISAARKGEVLNDMVIVSAKAFSVEETERFAGSRGDPARMASNFAGVQGSDDSRNDIVVRGNSPLGVLWRVEGVPIPNPNHFAVSGSTGGPVAILNNKMLANSDFFMSAFPAEYGNCTAGVFDLRLRNGNTGNHEFTGQFGFLGTEIMMEGPLKKGARSSYLLMGRYSTLSIFKTIGFQIGTDAVPKYGDLAFKFNFPLKNGGNLALFGIGGTSDIHIKISDQKIVSKELYGEGDRDQNFGTDMGISGIVYTKAFGPNTYFKSTLAGAVDKQSSFHEYIVRHIDSLKNEYVIDSMYPILGYNFKNYRAMGYLGVTHKFNRSLSLKAGLNADLYYINAVDSVLNYEHTAWINRFDYKGYSALIQPFFQWKYKIKETYVINAGLHSQYFSFSNSWSYAEPRVGLRVNLTEDKHINLGAGMHSSTQPLYLYTYHQTKPSGEKFLHNKNMDFSRSLHTVASYDQYLKNNLHIKTELYYQYLYNIPVDVRASSFSLLNQGSGFQRFFPDKLKNTGTGFNYGTELTVEKFFNKSFFFMATASLYNSQYKGSDKVERNTDFNGNYATNLLMGKEYKIRNNILATGIKVTAAGGKWYGYVDKKESTYRNELIYMDSAYNTRRFKDYFRFDLKVNYKINRPKVAHEFGLDLINLLNTKNILGLTFAPNVNDPAAEPTATQYQLGFLPIFYYRIDLKLLGNK